ncbi:fimbrial biogenesis chaperone [Pseudoxanthomonas composti]|uniref:Molecular chaperone n=1 Tax=Pseudoxanthomonas composti TaxID=2137479 RepID=A0A4Q1JYE5_9GAMM|nr:molecular chaperone [Pseudoxanthomonas composti]RXR08385.1 molecular chaperone [Pseudoxanthomonas composti]
MARFRLGRSLWMLPLLLVTGQALAASLQVAPTSLRLSAQETAQGLWLSNTSDAPLHAQVRVFRWRQIEGEDVLEPTEEVAISPPMLQLAPHSQQLVRVVRLSEAPAATEGSYRVLVDELPVEGAGRQAASGLQFVLRYSVPVFVAPTAAEAAPRLSAQVVVEDGKRMLEVHNTGGMHAQLVDLELAPAAGGSQRIVAGLAGYVLPGTHRRWPLPEAAPDDAQASFKAKINGEAQARDLGSKAQ